MTGRLARSTSAESTARSLGLSVTPSRVSGPNTATLMLRIVRRSAPPVNACAYRAYRLHTVRGRMNTSAAQRGTMNTATTPLRLTAAASVVALAVTLAGCATAEPASAAAESRANVAVLVTPAMHRALVQSAADRYVNELLVRARMAKSAQPASLDVVVLTRVSPR